MHHARRLDHDGVTPELEEIFAQRQAMKQSWLDIYDSIIIVAGSRSFNNYVLFKEVMDTWLQDYGQTLATMRVFLSGGAKKGADALIERWCKERDERIVFLPALWDVFEQLGKKKAAGFARNHEMGDVATHLVAFWDRKSSGTKDMIDYARKRNLCTVTVLVDPD